MDYAFGEPDGEDIGVDGSAARSTEETAMILQIGSMGHSIEMVLHTLLPVTRRLHAIHPKNKPDACRAIQSGPPVEAQAVAARH